MNIFLSIKFKDIVIGIMNLLIYVGKTWESLSFYGWSGIKENKIIVAHIIMIILSLMLIIILIYKMKANQIS